MHENVGDITFRKAVCASPTSVEDGSFFQSHATIIIIGESLLGVIIISLHHLTLRFRMRREGLLRTIAANVLQDGY